MSGEEMGLGWERDAALYAYVVRCPIEGRTLGYIDLDLVAQVQRSRPDLTERQALRLLIAGSKGRFALLYTHRCPDDVPSEVSDETKESRR